MVNVGTDHLREEGVVKALLGPEALVEALPSEHCDSCGAKHVCHSLGGEGHKQVKALNQAGAAPGDRVLLAMPRRAALGAGALVYLAPVAALIVGAALGNHWGPAWGWDPQNSAVVVGLAALVLCWLGLRWFSSRVAGGGSFTVRIVRVLQKGEADAVDQCSPSL